MAGGLCPNIKHVIHHSPVELANQNEDSALSPCSSSTRGQQRFPLAGEVVVSLLQQLPQQEYLPSANGGCPPPPPPVAIVFNGAYRKCSTHHCPSL